MGQVYRNIPFSLPGSDLNLPQLKPSVSDDSSKQNWQDFKLTPQVFEIWEIRLSVCYHSSPNRNS